MIVDSHCHLDFEDYAGDLPGVLSRARAAGIGAFVCIGSGRDISSARGAVKLAAVEPDVWASVGIHPHDAARIAAADWTEIDALSQAPRVVGIGETGLDYHYDHSPRDVQIAAFRRFVQVARARRLPVISHIREAHEEAAALLREEAASDVGGVIHCFTGNVADARRYLDLGQHISFSGILTFKKADDLRAAAAFAPLDKILVETDAPFLAPIPHRGKRNEPAFIVETLKVLAETRHTDLALVTAATTANARRLFRLD